LSGVTEASPEGTKLVVSMMSGEIGGGAGAALSTVVNGGSLKDLGENVLVGMAEGALSGALAFGARPAGPATKGDGQANLEGHTRRGEDADCLLSCDAQDTDTLKARAAAIKNGDVYQGRVRELPVTIYGGTAQERQDVANALYDVLGGKSARGVEMRLALDKRIGFFAADPDPLEIVLVRKTLLGSHSYAGILTLDLANIGKAYPSASGHGTFTYQRIEAHELGHIAFDANDDGIGKMFNVRQNENVVMRQLNDLDNRIAY
jgi:hypothetical protein